MSSQAEQLVTQIRNYVKYEEGSAECVRIGKTVYELTGKGYMGLLGKGNPSDGLNNSDRAAKMIHNVMMGNSPTKNEDKTVPKKKKIKESTKSLRVDGVDFKMFQAKFSSAASGSNYAKAKRNRPGTGNEEWEVFPHDEVSPGPQSVMQKIQYLIRQDVHNVKQQCTLPEGESPVLWQYEHLRLITLELNDLIVALSSSCNATDCPIMFATDKYEFRCAAHKNAQDCCAMDYMIHTLDSTSATLNSNKLFPSRLLLKEDDIKQCQSLARRLYRFFPHAFYHHRRIFDEFEERSSLCRRFLVLCNYFGLVDESNLLPPIKFSEASEMDRNTKPGKKGGDEGLYKLEAF